MIALARLEDALKVPTCRDILKTTHQLLVFVTVAMDEGISIKSIAQRTGMEMNTVTKVVAALESGVHNFKKSADVLRVDKDPTDRRITTVYLTEQGRLLAQAIAASLRK